MLDVLLARHLLIQTGRIALAALLLLVLAALGTEILRRCGVVLANRGERVLLAAATGFTAYQFVVRWLAELPFVSAPVMAAIVVLLGIAGARSRRSLGDDLRIANVPRDWPAVAILLLTLAPFFMALAPAVSRDAMIYHLRFPEMTLSLGQWAYDPATSASYYPAAAGTLYLFTLAFDRSGIAAQLVHFGFFLLCIGAVAAIARRLGATTGRIAALLFAALPAAAIVAGWAWADTPFLFALATSALALLAGLPMLALVLLGLAASIKYTALLAGLPLFVAIVIWSVRARAFRQLFGGIVLAALTMSPWLVTNGLRTGNIFYPLGDARQPAGRMVATWSAETGDSWSAVWSGYFLRPQTLDEDVGGLLFLVVAVIGLFIAFSRLRAAAMLALAMCILYLPLTAAMRLVLPAVVATLVVAGAALERIERRKLVAALVIAFAVRGGMVTAAHNAHFRNPLPAAIGIESAADYVHRNFAPAALYARAHAKLPAHARVLAINEVRLFGFPRPVTVSRILDPPLIRRYAEGAANASVVVQRLRADGITHLLVAGRPVERGTGIPLTTEEHNLVSSLIRTSRVIDREGNVVLLELP